MARHEAELVTLSQAARYLGLTRQAIGVLARHSDAPVVHDEKGIRCRWPAFARWREERLLARATPADFEEARARKMAAEAELAELELAQQRGALVTRQAVEEGVGHAFQRVRARLLALPAKASHELVGLADMVEVQRRLERQVDEVLRELGRPADMAGA